VNQTRMRGHDTRFFALAFAVSLSLSMVSWSAPGAIKTADGLTPQASVSVRDFGAKGDGVTNDTSAVQAAINAGSAPRTVVFPAGTYVFSNIIVKADTTVRFESGAAAVSPLNSSITDVFFAVIGSASVPLRNVTLEGGSFQGRPTIGSVLSATLAENLTVTDVHSLKALRCVGTDRSTHVTVRDSSSDTSRWGFAFEESQYVEITGCSTRHSERDGIVFYDYCRYTVASDNIVRDYMTVNDQGVGGIQVYGSRDATITGNIILNGHYDSAGIRFRDSEDFWCEGNYVSSPGSSAYQVARVGDYPGLDGGNGTFIRNVAAGSRLRGFDVSNTLSKTVRIFDNTVIDTTSSSSISAGMGIVAIPADSVVVGNHVEAASGAGIQAGDSGQLVAWNTVRDVGSVNFGPRVGIFVSGTAQAVVANDISDQYRSIINGVRTYTGSSALLKSNRVSGTTGSAYDIRGTLVSVLNGDSTPPSLTCTMSGDPKTGAVITATATDSQSGVVAVRISVDGSRPRVFPGGHAVLEATDVHWAVATAIDDVGNERSMRIEGQAVTNRAFERIAGDDRYLTSVKVSEAMFPKGAAVVVIATGQDYPDALTGGVLAHAEGGPILLVSDTIPAATGAEIARLKPRRAIILGSVSAVSAGIESSLKNTLGAANITRLAGTNRYDTARLIAKAVYAWNGTKPGGTAVVASGGNFPDALAAAPLAAVKGWPILLVSATSVPQPTSTAISSLEIGDVIVVGGASVVSKGVLDALPGARRIAGSNRYSTAVAVADYAQSAGMRYTCASIATGLNFPDALSGAVLAASRNGVMFLTPPTSLDANISSRLTANADGCERLVIFGSPSVVGPAVETAARGALE